MASTTTTGTTGYAAGRPDPTIPLPSRISWGAVFAGGVVAVAVGTMLNVLGLAIGATAVDATTGDTPGASTFGITAGVWLLVANTIGLLAGGYVAARLSGSGDSTDSVLHGLSVWAIGFLLSAVLLGNVVAGTANTAFQGASAILGGAAQGVGSAAGGAASAASGPLNQAVQQVDPRQLVERAQSALRSGGGDPAQMNSDQRNAEIAQILTRRVTDGNLPQDARDRLNRLVAAEYGIAPEEAQRRVQQVEQQATQTLQQAEQRAREAADATATAGAVGAYWVFAAMLLGAVAAVLGARVGTRTGPAVRSYA